ncbi:hypothetical protein HWC80_gp074 [Mycobacterium phage Indlulamithi]|uniref:Uncharacterized protein n=1 Tax=Mycobacterium phage Indlulamithi TaxID=2656582 RepID=A0A649VCS7_9CAUD|nr:hypothetical protein HWC80_gp074 [Mycobacterium phage Indlulamithi]QGJ90138.1 hypothetical protein PBI_INDLULAMITHI_100 [Mycobacterium phage Indlulamithi]
MIEFVSNNPGITLAAMLMFFALAWNLVDRIAEVRRTKWLSTNCLKCAEREQNPPNLLNDPGFEAADKFDNAVFDLHTFVKFLDEKGCLREGFRYDKVVEEYIA